MGGASVARTLGTGSPAAMNAAPREHPPAGPSPYDVAMPPRSHLDDARGVDVVRIRELVALTPAQRVEHMVQVVNTLTAIRQRAQAARR